MDVRFYSRLRPYLQIILLALVAVVFFLVFNILAILGAVLFFDIPFSELSDVFSSGSDNIPLLKFVQILNSIGLFIVPALVIGVLASSKPLQWLGFNNKISWLSVGWLLLIIIAMQPLVAYSGVLNQNMHLPDFLSGVEGWMKNMEDKAMGLTEAFLEVNTFGGLAVNILMVAIIPGIGEELFFRGMIQAIFTKWFKNVHVAIIVTAFLFSALHMQFYGFLPRFLLGILFGYIFVWSGNLWFPILAHLVHNTIPVVAYYVYSGELTETTVDSIVTSPTAWIYALIGAGFLVLLCMRFRDTTMKLNVKQ